MFGLAVPNAELRGSERGAQDPQSIVSLHFPMSIPKFGKVILLAQKTSVNIL